MRRIVRCYAQRLVETLIPIAFAAEANAQLFNVTRFDRTARRAVEAGASATFGANSQRRVTAVLEPPETLDHVSAPDFVVDDEGVLHLEFREARTIPLRRFCQLAARLVVAGRLPLTVMFVIAITSTGALVIAGLGSLQFLLAACAGRRLCGTPRGGLRNIRRQFTGGSAFLFRAGGATGTSAGTGFFLGDLVQQTLMLQGLLGLGGCCFPGINFGRVLLSNLLLRLLRVLAR